MRGSLAAQPGFGMNGGPCPIGSRWPAGTTVDTAPFITMDMKLLGGGKSRRGGRMAWRKKAQETWNRRNAAGCMFPPVPCGEFPVQRGGARLARRVSGQMNLRRNHGTRRVVISADNLIYIVLSK